MYFEHRFDSSHTSVLVYTAVQCKASGTMQDSETQGSGGGRQARGSSVIGFKRAEQLDKRSSAGRDKTATAAASAMQDATAATMIAATTVLAVLEFITLLSRACAPGWKKSDQIQRIGSFINVEASGSGELSETSGSEVSESHSGTEESSCSHKYSAHDAVTCDNTQHTPSSPADLAENHTLGKAEDKLQSGIGQPVAEMLEGSSDGSISTQNEIAFHGFRDSLVGDGSTTSGQKTHRSGSSRTFFSSLPAGTNQGQDGMSRITRMRLLRYEPCITLHHLLQLFL